MIGSLTMVFSLLLIGAGLYLRRISSDLYLMKTIGRRSDSAALDYLGLKLAEDCLRKGVGRTDNRPVFVMARQKLAFRKRSHACLVLGALGVAAGTGLVYIHVLR